MRKYLNRLFVSLKESNRFLIIPLITTASTVFLITATFLITYPKLPPKLPLFYSLPWGQAQLVFKSQFLILSIILILVTLINVLLTSQLHPSLQVLKRIILTSIIFVDLVLLITALKIIFVFI